MLVIGEWRQAMWSFWLRGTNACACRPVEPRVNIRYGVVHIKHQSQNTWIPRHETTNIFTILP